MNGGYGGPLAGENGELCNFDRRRPWPGTMAGNDKVMENGKLDPVTPCTLLVRGVSLQVPATLVVWWESLGAFARWVELSPLVGSTIVFALRCLGPYSHGNHGVQCGCLSRGRVGSRMARCDADAGLAIYAAFSSF